jgi:hypothetical protein
MGLFFLPVFVFAKGVCPDSSSRELARVAVAAGTELLACGSRLGMVRDLTVYSLKGEQRERVFDGDAAVKAYRWHRQADGFEIDEAVDFGSFRPFVRVQVTCAADGACQAQDKKCLWKRSKPDVKVVREIQRTEKPVSERNWTRAFFSALNGDTAARQLFQGVGLKNPAQAEHSERFSTYRADLVRLQNLGCLN